MPFLTQKSLLKPKHLIYPIITFQTSGYAPRKVKMSNEASHLTSPLTQQTTELSTIRTGHGGWGERRHSQGRAAPGHTHLQTHMPNHMQPLCGHLSQPSSFPHLQILNTNTDEGSVHHVPGPGGGVGAWPAPHHPKCMQASYWTLTFQGTKLVSENLHYNYDSRKLMF